MKTLLVVVLNLWCVVALRTAAKYSVGQFSVELSDPNRPLHTVRGIIYYPSNGMFFEVPSNAVDPFESQKHCFHFSECFVLTDTANKAETFPAIVFSPG